MKTFSGRVHYYYIYDISSDINLKRASELLGDHEEGGAKAFKLRKSSRAMVIEEAPLVLSLGSWEQEFQGKVFPVSAIAKIWGFGVISLCLRFHVDQSISLDLLKKFGFFLEKDDDVYKRSYELLQALRDKILPAAKDQSEVWEQFEDYIIYLQDNKNISHEDIENFLSSTDLYQLLLTDEETDFSEQLKKPIRDNTYQYSKNDLAVLDWNSAYLIDTGDAEDIADVIEFALCQLLEMRYYDDLLDKKLASLYRDIGDITPSIFSNKFNKFAREASILYIDISEIVERIENSLKIIGDFYYAKIYRAAAERFRMNDWKKSVDQKLSNLVEISMLFMNQNNEKKSHLLEIIIIFLILIEVVQIFK